VTRPAWHDAALARDIAGLPLVARISAAGAAAGRHASNLPGVGLEFAQYRGYQPGDDLRRVDWKLLARSDRFFVREAEADTALPVRIALDGSASMAHEEDGITKFDVARRIAAALAEVAIRHGDLASLAVMNDDAAIVPPSRDRRQLDRIIGTLDRATPTGSLPRRVDNVLSALGRGNGGVVVVITDWHDPEDVLRPALERTGLDASLLMLRTLRESDPRYGRPVTLEDIETGQRVTIDDAARHDRASVDARKRQEAQRGGVDVAMIDPADDLSIALRSWLAARAGRR